MVFFIICALTGCSNRSQPSQNMLEEEKNKNIDYPQIVDVEKYINNFSDIKLSDIVDSIEYIPLEFTPACPIDKKILPILTKDYIIVFTNRIYLFSRTGKFIREIGGLGKGPKEYGSHLLIGASDVDISNQIIYVKAYGSNRVQKYDFNGNHLGSIPINSESSKVTVIDSTSIFLHFALNWPALPTYKLGWVISQNGDTLYTKNSYAAPQIRQSTFKEAAKIKRVGLLENIVYKYADNPVFIELINDTLFTITSRGFTPRYILKLGKYKCPADISHGSSEPFSEIMSKCATYILYNGFSETDRFLLFTFQFDRRFCFGVFDKNNSLMNIWASDKSDNTKGFHIPDKYFPNDIDGGSDGAIPLRGIKAVQADQLIAELTPEHFSRSKAIYPEKKSALEKLVKNLNESDNPVVMVYHFKK